MPARLGMKTLNLAAVRAAVDGERPSAAPLGRSRRSISCTWFVPVSRDTSDFKQLPPEGGRFLAD